MKKARVTSRDVAQKAGVSYNTVSLVMRDSPLVAQETKQRVRAVIEQLGYQPHAAAAALRSARTNTIGFFVPGNRRKLDADTDVFYNQLLNGITSSADKINHYIILSDLYREQHSLALMNSSRIDGALVHFSASDTFIEQIIGRHIPLVLAGRESSLPVSWVKADEESGAFAAVTHLLELGHSRITMISARVGDDERNAIPCAREQGYWRALHQANMTFAPQQLHYGDWTYRSGYEAAQRILKLQPRPTALFISNELMAAGALQAIQDAGLRVPTDISLITVADSAWVEYVQPQLTAVHVPMDEVGIRALELLSAQWESNVEQPQHIIVPTKLVVRASTAPTGEQ